MIFYGRHPGRMLLVAIGYGLLVVWAIMALVGEHGMAGVGGLLGAVLAMERLDRRQFGTWAERRAVASAVLSGRDPGPDYRSSVDRIACKQVAPAQRLLGQVFVVLVLGGLGVACLVTAVVCTDWPLVWPGTALLLATAFQIGMERRATCRARAWLANPPPVSATRTS